MAIATKIGKMFLHWFMHFLRAQAKLLGKKLQYQKIYPKMTIYVGCRLRAKWQFLCVAAWEYAIEQETCDLFDSLQIYKRSETGADCQILPSTCHLPRQLPAWLAIWQTFANHTQRPPQELARRTFVASRIKFIICYLASGTTTHLYEHVQLRRPVVSIVSNYGQFAPYGDNSGSQLLDPTTQSWYSSCFVRPSSLWPSCLCDVLWPGHDEWHES